MTKKLSFISFFAALLLMTSCADDNLKPIVTFEQLGKGAYVKLSELINAEYDLADFDNSRYEYSIEFIDLENGNLVRQYDLLVSFVDLDGATQGPLVARTWDSGSFETVASGNKGLTNITLPLPEIANLFGLTLDDLAAGDLFSFDGSITTTDGRTFGAENSSAAINGSAFQGHFDFTVKATCPLPDDLWVGSYNLEYIGDASAGFGVPFAEGEVTVTTVAGSTTLRQFVSPWGPDIGGFDVPPVTWDFVCDNAQFQFLNTDVGCGGSITLVQDPDKPTPIADLLDDSELILNVIEFDDDGGCGVDPAPKTMKLTKN